ncbi:PAS domain-containing protein [Urbifossiella limnaea]|uniref:histidine kinase n=1 Tax=Urbifossiella limnaea TaxID=2528023 RepID=A0A517Y252_9BACT|nr:PAS domain-containing protein [Urbifossiella limnaea]QDU23856.1 putative diguanylate cyclase [Urbifossiella limnaea]
MDPSPVPPRVLDHLPQLVWAAGSDGAVEYLNRRCTEYAGLPADDLLGWDWGWVVHPDDLPAVLTRWAASVRDGLPHRDEFRLRRSDGEYRWFLARGEPVRDADGRVVRWVGTCTDFDYARRSVAGARDERRLVRAFLDRSRDGHALVGADRVVRYASAGLAALLGRAVDALVGTDARDWVHRDDRPRLRMEADELLTRAGERVEAPARLRHADGSYRRVRLQATNLLRDPDVRAVAVTVLPAGAG